MHQEEQPPSERMPCFPGHSLEEEWGGGTLHGCLLTAHPGREPPAVRRGRLGKWQERPSQVRESWLWHRLSAKRRRKQVGLGIPVVRLGDSLFEPKWSGRLSLHKDTSPIWIVPIAPHGFPLLVALGVLSGRSRAGGCQEKRPRALSQKNSPSLFMERKQPQRLPFERRGGGWPRSPSFAAPTTEQPPCISF